jgi:L-lactate dehydrogenase complex protein LldF
MHTVLTPNMEGLADFKHLSFASSLCGNCTEVCAVKINIHELLLDNRSKSVEEGYTTLTERAAWKMWKIASLRRGMMNLGNGTLKNKVVNGLFKDWTKHRSNLDFSKKTFNQMWKEKNKN